MSRETLGIGFLALSSLLILVWFSLSLLGWILVGQRLWRGQTLVEIEPRVGVRPGLSDVFFALGCFVVALYCMQVVFVMPVINELNPDASAVLDAQPVPPVVDATDQPVVLGAQSNTEKSNGGNDEAFAEISPAPPENSPLANLQVITRGMIAQSVASVLATLTTILWMALNGIRPIQAGMLPRLRDVKLGVLGVVLLLPPLYILQGYLVRFVPYEHKILDILKAPQAWQVFLAMGIGTAIIAPICEEFFFRGLFQGWLESLGANRRSTEQAVPRWPILCSSLLFALAHLGQGPAPISLFVLSLGLGYLYRQTGNIWAGVIVHMTLNGLTTIVLIVSNVLELQN